MIGQIISHFEILAKLGQGGMGVVYKARDLKLNRLVALKFVRGEDMNPERRKRLLREAEAAAGLHHPNICTIYEVDEIDGNVFLAMAYVEGRTLSSVIKDGGAMDIARAIRLGAQLADALETAHARGVVHRDIKGDNIMVTDQDQAVILDFGLAQVGGGSRITKTGKTVGTAAYMSPEQARGEIVDRRSDIWSLGVVLYECLTGNLPFEGDYDLATMYSIVNEDPPELHSLRPEAPVDLANVVSGTLVKDVAARYQSAHELRNDLNALQGSGAVTQRITLRRSGVRPAPQSTWRSQPRIWALAAIFTAAVGLLGAGFWTNSLWRGPSFFSIPEEKHLVVLPFQNVGAGESDRAFGDGLVETLAAKLTGMQQFHGGLLVVPANEVRAEQVESVAQARRMFEVNLAITGSLQRASGGLRLTASLVDAESLRQLRSFTLDVSPDDEVMLQDGVVSRVIEMLELEMRPDAREALSAGGSSRPQAYHLYLEGVGYLGRFDQKGNIDRAIERFESAIEMDPNYAPAHAALSEAYWRNYTATEQNEWVAKALESAQRAVRINDRLAIAHIKLGEIFAQTSRHEEAISEFRRALDLDPLNPEVYWGLARLHENAGESVEAEQALLDAIALQPDNWRGHDRLGVYLFRQARYEEAEKSFLAAIKATPDNHIPLRNIAGLYHMMGKPDEARSYLQRSIEIQPTSEALSNLGVINFSQSRFEEAREAFERAISLGSDSHVIWGNLGDSIRAMRGKESAAKEAYGQAVEQAGKRLAVRPQDSYTRTKRAQYLAKSGRVDEALTELNRLPKGSESDMRVLFGSAVVMEIAGQRTEALAYLSRAVEKGYPISDIEADTELADLRRDASYVGAIRTK